MRAALFSEATPAPMVVPPARWKTFWGPGPYLTARFPLARTNAAHRRVLSAALRDRAAPLARVLGALDYLGATPWRIARPVLDTVREVWNEAGDPAGRGGHARVPWHPRVPDMPTFEVRSERACGGASEVNPRSERSERIGGGEGK